jgi:hypothetical protein
VFFKLRFSFFLFTSFLLTARNPERELEHEAGDDPTRNRNPARKQTALSSFATVTTTASVRA